MNKVVYNLLDRIEKSGFVAYVVGGFVRDYLLGIDSFDIDICTDASPDEIKRIFCFDFEDTYGSFHFDESPYKIDITTFRKEYKYDKRKPIEYEFVKNIEEDILRRDFTINAIYMDKTEKLIDPLNGRSDLDNKLICLIGGEEKLQEDPLRMLRAIRLASVLNFDIDNNLFHIMQKNKHLILSLSGMRIKEEYNKILMNKNYAKGLLFLEKLGFNSLLKIKYNDIIYTDNVLGMWAQIKCVNMPFTKVEKSNIIKITEIVNNGAIDEEIIYKYGLEISVIAGEILQSDIKIIKKMYEDLPIKNRNDINISNEEIIALTDVKPSVVWFMLEKEILHKRINNKKDELKKYIIKIKESD